MTDKLKIAFIGLGAMGSGIAMNIAKAGFALRVFNRTAARAEPLAQAGATVGASPADAARDADIVITMLADDAATEKVVWGEHGILAAMRPGAIHLAMSTISVALSERLTGAHREAGQDFVAAPVLGRPDAAAQGKLFVALAGAPAARDRVRPVLDSTAQSVTEVDEVPAQATLLKLIANFMISTVIESVAEANALATKRGLDPQAMLAFLTGSIFGAPVYKNYGAMITQRKFEPAGFALPLGQKDNRLVLQAAETAHVPMPFATLIRDRYLTARALGWDRRDWSAISEVALRDAGIEDS